MSCKLDNKTMIKLMDKLKNYDEIVFLIKYSIYNRYSTKPNEYFTVWESTKNKLELLGVKFIFCSGPFEVINKGETSIYKVEEIVWDKASMFND